MQFFPEAAIQSQLVARNITNPAVLDAMRAVPRHAFVPAALHARAYADCALPIALQQTISQPYIVARMAQALLLDPADTVLEIGTGSGYAAAVLSLLAKSVVTLERHQQLLEKAATICTALGYATIQFHQGDGSLGWPQQAPFDAVSVAACAPTVPRPLLNQLALNGRLVIPVGSLTEQFLLRVVRTDQGFQYSRLGSVRFVPLVGAAGWDDG